MCSISFCVSVLTTVSIAWVCVRNSVSCLRSASRISISCALAVCFINSRLLAPSCLICSVSVRSLIMTCNCCIVCCACCNCAACCLSCICICGGILDLSSTCASGLLTANRSAIVSAPGKSILRNTKSPICGINVGSAAITAIIESTASERLLL